MKLKKLLASILAICMVLSTMSFNVFAENENSNIITVATAEAFQNALDAASDGTIIQLTAGVDYGTVKIQPVKDNENTITGTDYHTTHRTEYVREVENLTIIGADGATVDGIEIVTGTQQNSIWYYADIENLVIDSVTFTENTIDYPAHSVDSPIFISLESARVDGLTVKNCVMNGGNKGQNFVYIYGKQASNSEFETYSKNITITGNKVENVARLCELRETENVTITGNTITNTKQHAILFALNSGKAYSGNIEIVDNTADSIGDRFVRMAGAGDATVTIADNEVTNYNGKDTDFIKVSDCNSAENVTIVDNTLEDEATTFAYSNGTCSVIDDDLVAKIGDTYYMSLADAVAEAKKGDTIVVYSNLDELATIVNSDGATLNGLTVQLGADIDLNNEEWTPIGNSTNKFQGIFDGDNHTISNLKITGTKSYSGLFGFTTNGEIKNLTVENALVSGRLGVGVVAGSPYTSKYTNITVKGHVEVNGMAYVGGVGGRNAYSNWTDITVDVDDTSYVKAVSTEDGIAYRTYVGGVIGFMGEGSHTVKNVKSNIDVIGDVCDVGGIVGIAHYGNTFENIICSGDITNTNTNAEDAAETGAIAGVWHNQQGQKVTFINCEYTGDSNVALIGAAYNANDTTADSSGSLVIDGNTSWPSEARIGMTGYASLEDAIAAAVDGNTITLINDVELDAPVTIKTNITIDGNGKTITQSATCNNNIALLYFEGSDGNVLDINVKNLTFDGLKVGAAIRTLNANINIDECVFQNCAHTVGQGLVRLTKGTASVTNSKFLNNNCSMGISFNWDTAGLATDTFTVDNCEFTGNTANKTALIYYVKGAGCEIKNSEFVNNNVNTANNCAVIYLGFQENCSVTGCLFEANDVVDSSTSTRVAGAIFFGYEAEISGNAFINNTASNANGDALGQICTSTYYECEINLSENYFGGQEPVEGKDYYIQHKKAEGNNYKGEFVLNNYYQNYKTDAEGNIVLDGRVDVNKVVATNGEAYYYSLQDAVDAAKAGDEIILSTDVEESIIVNAPQAAYAMRSTASGVTINLNGKTLTGDITVNSDATITIKNGAIINENSDVSAIQTYGTTTIENVDITSARHGVRVENGKVAINGGTYKVNNKDGKTTHAINVGEADNACEVVISDGTFIGPKGTAADSGSAVNVKAGSTVIINGGKFSGGKNNTLSSKGTLVVNEGMFDQDPAAYIAPTSEAIDRGAYEYPYGVAPKAAAKINVTLEKTANKNVYDIVINSDGEYDIYEFVSAELTFANDSETVGKSYMDYEIRGYEANGTFAQEAKDAINLAENEEQYVISLVDGAKRLSGDGIIIGQVEFFGQGTLDFKVTKGEVDTTWQNTNLGRYYVNEKNNDDIVDDDTDTLLLANAFINDNIPEVNRDVAVNVAFNHNIDDNTPWDNYQITATLKNNAMNWSKELDVTIKDIKSGACVFKDVPVGYITVTLKAPGFRTYTYETTLEETKDNGVLVLNFWNDVKKGNDEAIEKGKATMPHNFVVGDIVMDMTVDKYDLAAVTSYYGTYDIDKAQASKYIKYDLNRDGDIDIRDVQYVLHTMGN